LAHSASRLAGKPKGKLMAKFEGRRGDLVWGKYNYPVTRTQKAALDGIWYMMSKLPRGIQQEGKWALPDGGFYSQRPENGDVVIGLYHQSLNVHRNGRVTSNERISKVNK
jgi:hypothetical protein